MPELKIGRRFCQCGACGEYFNSPSAFDMHRFTMPNGGRGCKTPEAMVRAGFSKNDAGYWITETYNHIRR